MRKLRGVHLAAGFFAVLLLISAVRRFSVFQSTRDAEPRPVLSPARAHSFLRRAGAIRLKPFIYKTELTDPLDAVL